MDNILQFPSSGDNGSNEPPLSVAFSATPDQMLQFCMGLMLQLQASVDAMTIALGGDLTMLLMEAQKESIDSKELIDSYRKTRAGILKELYRELQERFPPKR